MKWIFLAFSLKKSFKPNQPNQIKHTDTVDSYNIINSIYKFSINQNQINNKKIKE